MLNEEIFRLNATEKSNRKTARSSQPTKER
jgi:hypothetical protein